MIKILILFFILGFLTFILSLCFASAREEEFYDKLTTDKKIEGNNK